MPCRYVIDKERKLVVSTAWGHVTADEMMVHDDRLRSDPDFSPEFNQLADGTGVESVEGTRDEMRRAAGRSPFSLGSRRAFVAVSTFVYGMERMITTYIEMSKTPSLLGVFHDLPSALEWLGLKNMPDLTVDEAKKPDTTVEGKNNEKIA